MANDRGPADLEERIEYLTNQNKFLKSSLEKLSIKFKDLENEYDKLWEENQNIRLIKNKGNKERRL